MKIWIVGKEGLLAKALAKACEKRGLEYFATAQAQADVTRIETLKPFAADATHIINCAAYTNVDLAENEPSRAFAINAEGPKHLAQVTRGKIIHVSTDYVFDGFQNRPYQETDTCNPLSVYGKSKWEGEQKLLEIDPTACVVRTSWLFGDGGKSFISSLLQRMQTTEEVVVAGDQVGSPTWVGDCAEALLNLLDHAGIFHFTNGGEVTRFQIAQEMLAAALAAGLPLACKRLVAGSFSAPAPRPQYSVLATHKIEQALNKPCRPWKDAIKEHVICAL